MRSSSLFAAWLYSEGARMPTFSASTRMVSASQPSSSSRSRAVRTISAVRGRRGGAVGRMGAIYPCFSTCSASDFVLTANFAARLKNGRSSVTSAPRKTSPCVIVTCPGVGPGSMR